MRRSATLDLEAVLAELLAPGGGSELPTDSPDEAVGARQAVVRAAAELLAERGTRGWTMEDVAERAAVGRATVYRRFATREDLVRETLSLEARRFFGAIADSVRDVEPLEEKVVAGFVQGLRLARHLALSSLLRNDPLAAVSLLRSDSLLSTATAALVERYERLRARPLTGSQRAAAELAAEGLVRLALSFVLVPGPTADDLDDERARAHLGAIVRPLLSARALPAPPPRRPPSAT